MEKLFFSKVETWVVLVLAIVGLIGMIIFGSIVRHVAIGGDKLGSFGDGVYQISRVPDVVAAILRDEVGQRDFVAASTARSFPDETYETVSLFEDPELDDRPLLWRADALDAAPAAVMVRLNREQRDEHLLILDGARNVVKHFPVTAPSLSGQFYSRTGNAAPVMLDDGSVIVFAGGADGLYRKSLCGEVIWALPGLYHHSISVADGVLGILGLPKEELTAEDQGDERWNHSEIINLISVESGDILKSIRLDDIAIANADRFDPFLRNRWYKQITEDGVLLQDEVHLNKVEILPQSLADQYPDFPAGAVMLSSRAINLVAIFDPETLEILWYSQGHTQGQHDPEFIGDNKIIVFDNAIDKNSADPAARANFTSIKQYDFSTSEWSVVWNGADVDGYTAHSGEVAISDDGSLLINLTLQGRYVEVSPDGEIVMDLINVADDGNVYWTKHAQYLTPSQFEIARSTSCKN